MRKHPILILLLLTLAISGPVQPQTSINREIIDRWMRSSRAKAANLPLDPWLVPIDLLMLRYENWSAAERQRIPKKDYDNFHSLVAKVAASGRPYDCNYWKTDLYISGPPEPTTLLDRVAGNSDVVIGRVEKVVPVWELFTEKLSSLVYLRVEETIKGTIPVGTIVKHYRSNAIAKVGRVTLCSRRRDLEGNHRTSAEDNVTWLAHEQEHQIYLIAGRLSPTNKWFLETTSPHEFRVIGGAAFEAGLPTSLNEIYERLAAQ